MIVVLQCSTKAYRFVTSATIPVSSSATVIVPTRDVSPNKSTISESGMNVWTDGKFFPGVQGITDAVALDDGSGVLFTVGSGAYTFYLEA
jgi:hypothetical protein